MHFEVPVAMGDSSREGASRSPVRKHKNGDDRLHHSKHKSHKHRPEDVHDKHAGKHRRDETEEERKERKRVKKAKQREGEKLEVLDDDDDGGVWVEKGVGEALVSPSSHLLQV